MQHTYLYPLVKIYVWNMIRTSIYLLRTSEYLVFSIIIKVHTFLQMTRETLTENILIE